MGRRQGGGDKLFNKQQEAKEDLARKKERMKLVRIIIACEDIKIAPLYFQSLFTYLITEHKISATSFVIAKHEHTNPDGVLKDLENHKDKFGTYKDFDHKWIVIDRDEERTNGGGHTLENYNKAFSRAKQLSVEVAFSNPAFEIWYLLHFKYQSTYIDRDTVNKQLKLRGYDKDGNIFEQMYDILLNMQYVAIENAKRLIKQHEKECSESIQLCNPSTAVHELVELLNGYQKSA